MSRKRPPADRTSERRKTKRGRVNPGKTEPPHATAEVPDDKTDAPAANEDKTADDDVDQDPDTSHASAPDPDLHKTKILETAASDLEDETDAPTASQDRIPEEPTNQEPDASNSCASEPDTDETAVSQASTSRVDNGIEASMSDQDKASEAPDDLLDLTWVDLARDLHSILKYSIYGEFFLFCHLRNGRSGWVAEEKVQIEAPFTLNTFWESREDVPGRPHAEVCEKVFKIMPQQPRWKKNCVIWRIGEPYFTGTPAMISYLTKLKDRWKAHFRLPEVITLSKAEALYPETSTGCWEMSASSDSDPVPQMIFSHRKTPKYKKAVFEFFILYDSCDGEWKSEVDIQKEYPAAVETYWQSHPGLREKESLERLKVPEQCFKIHSHRFKGGKTLLKVQLVGKSDCEEFKASRALKRWKEPTERYLEKHKLQI